MLMHEQNEKGSVFGKINCVPGRNGFGKTSLLRAIVDQHALTSGRITFEGKELGRATSYDRARSGIAFVQQGPELGNAAGLDDPDVRRHLLL